MKLVTLVAVALVTAFSAAGVSAADGNVKKGKKIYRKCAACHYVDKQKKRVGPHLVGIIGRKAASVSGFKYSKAMKAKGKDGLVWTEENLSAYLIKPRKFIKGTKMVFSGLKKPQQRIDLIAYIRSASKPK